MNWDALGNNRNWILERENIIRNARFEPLGRSDVSVTASHNAEDIPKLFSRDSLERWSPGQGAQRGDEWLLLRFPEIQRLDGIELFLGPYVTDFPRGLRMKSAPECDAESKLPQQGESSLFSAVTNYPAWYGGLEFTPHGLPYFKGRYSVKVYFPATIQSRCILIEQTAASVGTDWSVAGLRVLRSQ
jgi:hypothetical protein